MMAEAVANQNTPTPPPAPVVEDTKVSSKLHVLVQREKQALERERIAKQKEAEFEARMKEFEPRESKIAEFERVKKEGDYNKALELLGIPYQDLTSAMLNDGKVTPEIQVKKVEERLETYLKSQEEAEKQKAEHAKREAAQREEQVTASFKSEIKSFLDENADKYELLKFEQMDDDVYLVIDEHYNRTIDPVTGVGKILTVQEAADKIEASLEKKYTDSRELKKFKVNQLPPEINKVVQQSSFTPRQQQKTLTNTSTASPTPPRTKPLTDEERVQKAIAYARSLRT
jgi:hypothetical protein